MNWILACMVIFLTFTTVMGWVSWWLDRPPRVPVERLADPAPLPGEPAMIDPLAGCDCGCGDALPRAGRLPVTFQGAADPAQQLQPFDPLRVLADALTIAEQQVATRETADQVKVLWAEMEATWGTDARVMRDAATWVPDMADE